MKRFFWLFVSLAVVIIDLITKGLAQNGLILNVPHPIAKYLNFTLVYNHGSAFGFLSKQGGWQVWFLVGLAIVISACILIWLYKLPRRHNLTACSLSLILGGALGNLISRVSLGFVVDFIDVYYKSYHWPAFNVADMAICIGVALLVIAMFANSR